MVEDDRVVSPGVVVAQRAATQSRKLRYVPALDVTDFGREYGTA
jgi:hypothetical protein